MPNIEAEFDESQFIPLAEANLRPMQDDSPEMEKRKRYSLRGTWRRISCSLRGEEIVKLMKTSSTVHGFFSPFRNSKTKTEKQSPEDKRATRRSQRNTICAKDLVKDLPGKENINHNVVSPKKRKLTSTASSSKFNLKKMKKGTSKSMIVPPASLPVKKPLEERKKNRVFGVPLEVLMFEQRKSKDLKHLTIPLIAKNAIQFLLLHGLGEKGLFRMSANQTTLMDLKQDIEDGKLSTFDPSCTDCHTVACLLKMFLREIPNSLLTAERLDMYHECLREDLPPDLETLEEVLKSLPPYHYSLTSELFHLFACIAANQEVNSMSASNLATSNAPSLLFPKNSALETMDSMMLGNRLVTIMIENFDILFPNWELNDLKSSAANVVLPPPVIEEVKPAVVKEEPVPNEPTESTTETAQDEASSIDADDADGEVKRKRTRYSY